MGPPAYERRSVLSINIILVQRSTSFCPRLLDPLYSGNQIGDKSSRVLRRWKVPQPSHALEIGTLDLLRRRLRHLRCSGPVVLASQEVHWAFLTVDLTDTITGVKAAKVEVEISMEDTVRLAGIQMPDEQLVREDGTVSKCSRAKQSDGMTSFLPC